jgi:hypothetical protein
VRTVNYLLQCESDRLKAKRKDKPIAQSAEDFFCRRLGIVQDGKMVTELAIQEFARRFEGEVHDYVLQAMGEVHDYVLQAMGEVHDYVLQAKRELFQNLGKLLLYEER